MKKLFLFALLFSPVLIFTQNWSTVTKSCFIEVLPAVRTTHVPEAGWLEIFPNPTAGWAAILVLQLVAMQQTAKRSNLNSPGLHPGGLTRPVLQPQSG